MKKRDILLFQDGLVHRCVKGGEGEKGASRHALRNDSMHRFLSHCPLVCAILKDSEEVKVCPFLQ